MSNEHKRHPRRTKTATVNRIQISLTAERDTILENSRYYRENMASFSQNRAGLICQEQGRNLPSIRLAALRYAGVPLRSPSQC